MPVAESYVCLDTNVLLHYRRPDYVDWKKLLGASKVTLIVTPALIDELEAQKVNPNRPAKLRDRAHKSIMWLAQYAETMDPTTEIAAGVHLFFVKDSPLINFDTYKLSRLVPDDQLIASAIQFREERGVEVLFVTNDTGLRLKLSSRGFKAIAPLGEDRLPDEPDQGEQEIARLRDELSRFQNRQPSLQLRFAEGGTHTTIELLKPKQSLPERQVLPSYVANTYNEQFARYVTELQTWRKTAARMFECELILDNTNGTAEATDINVDLYFPEFVLPMRELPKVPKEPRNPLDPRRFDIDTVPIMPRYGPRPPGMPFVNTHQQYVAWEIPSLVHNALWCFTSSIFGFPMRSQLRISACRIR